MKPKIFQFCHRLVFGDAITNHMLELWRAFSAAGYESNISAFNVNANLREKDAVIPLEKLDISPNDVLIFHNCGSYDHAFTLGRLNCLKILVFHNETPVAFLYDYTRPVGAAAGGTHAPIYPPFLNNVLNIGRKARLDIKKLPPFFPHVWAVSQYNARYAREAGFGNIEVLPIPYRRSDITVTQSILDKNRDTKNILFVGRVVSHKKHADLIRAFAYYNKIEPNSRLFMVGGFEFSENYREEYLRYAESLGLKDNVFFPGKVSYEDLEAYWQCADLFLSMSEHEGFCVPVIEAFAHDVPVLAYASSAVTETVGEAGVLFYEKNFPRVAEVMHSIISSPKLSNELITAGRERIKEYTPERLAKQAVSLLESTLEKFQKKGAVYMAENNDTLDIKEIVAGIRQNIHQNGYTKDMLSFNDDFNERLLNQVAESRHSFGEMHIKCHVQPYRPLTGNRLVVFFKKVIRKLLKFYIMPIVGDQNEFNVLTANRLEILANRITALEEEIAAGGSEQPCQK